MKMTTMIASVNCYGGFLKTNPKILQTFFTYILEAQQFTLSKVTLHQVLSTQVNSSRLDKVQNMPVEKILSADFLSLEFVKSELQLNLPIRISGFSCSAASVFCM